MFFICRLYSSLLIIGLAYMPKLEARITTFSEALTTDTLPYTSKYLAICDTVAKYFYDPVFIEAKFPVLKKTYLEKVKRAEDPQTFSFIINDLLNEFNISHTAYYTTADGAYYHLASIFNFLPTVKRIFREADILYPSIGLLTERDPRGHKITGILPGSAAEAAGFQRGDYLLSQNGAPYQLDQLKELVHTPVSFGLIRDQKPQELSAIPIMINPQDELEAASRASIRRIKYEDQDFGYIRLWSFAGARYYELLKETVRYGALKDSEALILDLRGGWGGANPEYLNLFNQEVPVMTFQGRDGQPFSYDSQWRKPVVLLVDDRVRSGKEILAFGFRKYQIGKVIGTNTAGAVTGGRIFFMPDGNLLYLAVNMASIDGEILEGKGVAPDILVADDPETLTDEILDEALLFLSELLKK